jgi:hypothetical protein
MRMLSGVRRLLCRGHKRNQVAGPQHPDVVGHLVQVADEDHGQGPHDDHWSLTHSLDKREAGTERSPGRSGVADDHGLSPLGKLEEVRERDPDGWIVVRHRTIDPLGRMLRPLHIF